MTGNLIRHSGHLSPWKELFLPWHAGLTLTLKLSDGERFNNYSKALRRGNDCLWVMTLHNSLTFLEGSLNQNGYPVFIFVDRGFFKNVATWGIVAYNSMSCILFSNCGSSTSPSDRPTRSWRWDLFIFPCALKLDCLSLVNFVNVDDRINGINS